MKVNSLLQRVRHAAVEIQLPVDDGYGSDLPYGGSAYGSGTTYYYYDDGSAYGSDDRMPYGGSAYGSDDRLPYGGSAYGSGMSDDFMTIECDMMAEETCWSDEGIATSCAPFAEGCPCQAEQHKCGETDTYGG